MQAYDLLMLIVLALAIVWGAWKGLAWQIASTEVSGDVEAHAATVRGPG